MEGLLGPLLMACALLALAGAQKVLDPAPTVGALRAMGLPSRPSLVRAVAAVELGLAALAVTVDHWAPAAAMAASYMAFAAFVEAARGRGAMVSSCGCFGKEDTPPTLVHVLVNAALAAVCAVWAANGRGVPVEMVVDQPWSGVPLLALVALGTGLLYLTLTVLPRTLAAGRLVAQG